MDPQESITKNIRVYFEREGRKYYFYLSELLNIVKEMIDQEIDQNEIEEELNHLSIFGAKS